MDDDLRRKMDAVYRKKVEQVVDKATRHCAVSILAGLAEETPVDTGRARANWNTAINEPDLNEYEPDDEPEERGRLSLTSFKLGDTIRITNNLPYIKPLNDGHSKNTPEGFVERSVQAAGEETKRFAKEIGKDLDN